MAISIPTGICLEELYQIVKKALEVFDLEWDDKSKIRVCIVGEYLEFKYGMNVYQHYIGKD